MWDGYLSAEYNSLQVAFNRQFSKGLMLKGAYTWSHAIDYADDDGWARRELELGTRLPTQSSYGGLRSAPGIPTRLGV